jgi:hypothetical protein
MPNQYTMRQIRAPERGARMKAQDYGEGTGEAGRPDHLPDPSRPIFRTPYDGWGVIIG